MALGEWDKIGNDDAFAASDAVCLHDGSLWTVSGGQLSRVSLATGEWERVHDGEDWAARLIVPFRNTLWIVKPDGTVDVFDPANGSVEVGPEGAFAQTTHAIARGDRMFGIVNQMVAQYEDSGDWQPTDGNDRGECRGLADNGDAGFFLLDGSGMHHVSVGNEINDIAGNVWNDVQGFTRHESKLYVVAENGNIYGIDPTSGEQINVSETADWTSKFVFAHEGALYLVSYGGTLFRGGTVVKALLGLVLVAGIAHAGPTDYPGSREMCNEHVSGNSMHITWRSVATTDDVAKVVAHYQKSMKKPPTTGEHGDRTFAEGELRVIIFGAKVQDKFPKCSVKAKDGETVIITSTAAVPRK